MKKLAITSALMYVALIVTANLTIAHWGFIPVGFGYVAPAGTYFAGAVFIARDTLQISLGRYIVLLVIAIGCLLSWLVSPSFALASAIAFGLGELSDWLIFTPLIERRKVISAFAISNVLGLFVDTFAFLSLAFGSVNHWQGTAIGKLWLVIPVFFLRLHGRRKLLAISERSRKHHASRIEASIYPAYDPT